MIRRLTKPDNWWIYVIGFVLFLMIRRIVTDPESQKAFDFIFPGIKITFLATIISFSIAVVIGMFAGIARISKNKFFSTIARAYIEFIRGVPVLILIYFIALVLIIPIAEFFGFQPRQLSMLVRGIAALSIFYGAYIAEVFRAGIESVGIGQREGGLSLGLTNKQTMRFIVLPQAFRNMLPALGNDFISMMKDSSLLSLLAIGEITYQVKLYSGSTFRFNEAYSVSVVIYLCITLLLSALQRRIEVRLESS
tara:strand:+ start:39 stop:791 length:753 start_codon:yes stop_codon:yes gene_type:complete